ncbi:MAG: hypothetical protein HZC18_06775 [Candidatus Omnitrophica bacterium]|nr:hypothetical protein [Candidatus Omnitrophota bacterium]
MEILKWFKMFFRENNRRRLLRQQLEKESKVTRAASLEVLHEMEELDDDLNCEFGH